VIAGWGVAQWPYLIVPDLTAAEAAAPKSSLGPIVIGLAVGAALDADPELATDDDRQSIGAARTRLEEAMRGSDSQLIRDRIEEMDRASLPFAQRRMDRAIQGALVHHKVDEIEAELRTYRALYQPLDHAANLVELRSAALEAMRALAHFKPYLTGPVLKGIAGPHAAIELQLFPENSKDVELFLLEHSIGYSTHQSRRFAGDRAHPVSGLTFDWNGVQFKLSVFDPRDERLALKTSVAGRALERAGIREVAALLSGEHGAPQA